MLHPHIPHELKDFGKHLFATFLGLLMALGLEQIREHYVEAKRAAHALVSVETELKENLVQMDRQISRCTESIRTADALELYVTQVLAARRQGKPQPPMPKMGALGVASSFYMDAWETLKGLGVLHHIAPDRGRRLSRAYLGFAWLRQGVETNPILRQVPSAVFLVLEKPESLPQMDTPHLEQALDGIRLMRMFYRWAQNEMGHVKGACEVALRV